MAEQQELTPVDEEWERALAVVAHPDDLEYGAASAVARWTSQGKTVVYLLLTRGQAGIDGMHPSEAGPLREEEERRSARAVGVDTVEFLDYADGTIEYSLGLRRDIARAIRTHRPQVIISMNPHATWGNQYLNMADHRVAGEATLDAARDAGNRWVFPELLEEGLEPWSGAHAIYFSGSPLPTHAVDVTEYLDRGVASLREHQAYISGLGGEFDVDVFLRGSAASTGKLFGTELAVSFEMFRL
jgi:LmbE family N-acetylglucosaminyl deacetylase